MSFYIKYLVDVLGKNYLGLEIPNNVIERFLEKLMEIVGYDEYELLTYNQQKRDNNKYHLTLINVMEFNKLSNEIGMSKFINSLDKIFNYEIDDLSLKGIGSISDNINITYFIVCESDKLDAVRERYNLPKRDLHITIGFNKKDVFSKRKNEVKWIL